MSIFSKRLPESLEPNAWTRAVARCQKDPSGVLDLSITNPTKVGLEYPWEDLQTAFVLMAGQGYDPDPQGLQSARETVARELSRQRGRVIDPNRIWLTSSTSEAYSFLFKLLANAGDEFFVPTPSYPLFEPLATLEGVRTVYYKLRLQDRWEIDFDSLRAQLTEKTKGMIVVQPNNPTGSMLSFPEFKETCEIAQSHRVPLIVDEVFRSYSMNHSPDPITSLAIEKGPVTFTLGGLSKEFGLPQLKLGWIHVNGPDNEINTISERLDWICDAYLSVGTPVQQTLPAIFEIGPSIRQAIRQRIQKNNRILADQVGSSYRPLPVEGGWSAIVALPERIDEEEFALRLMSRDRVIVQPGYFFDLPFPSLVLSLLTPHTSFVQGLERIERQIPDFNG